MAMDGYLYAAGGHDGFTAVNIVERCCRVDAFKVDVSTTAKDNQADALVKLLIVQSLW